MESENITLVTATAYGQGGYVCSVAEADEDTSVDDARKEACDEAIGILHENNEGPLLRIFTSVVTFPKPSFLETVITAVLPALPEQPPVEAHIS
jgi:hypothetical protein